MNDPASNVPDLAKLRERFPGWALEAQWYASGSGPDGRRLVARRGDVTVSAWDAASLAEAIRQEEAR